MTYTILELKYNNASIPVILDTIDYREIIGLNKTWICAQDGEIYCLHDFDGNGNMQRVYMKDIIIIQKINDMNLPKKQYPIIHKNFIGLDNRRANITYKYPPENLTVHKRKRYVELPPNCGINLCDIPTYISYVKPDKTHGDRFMVEYKDVIWKSTSSKKVSLKYKLEEAKKYLHNLINNREANDLLDSFYKIIYSHGYYNIKQLPLNNDLYNAPDNTLPQEECSLLNSQIFINKHQRRRLLSNLPQTSGLSIKDLPEYCYYVQANDTHGDYFVYHPPSDKIWYTPSKRTITTRDKYDMLMTHYNQVKKNILAPNLD